MTAGSLRVLIPARAPALGKTRLAAALSPEQRMALGLSLFDHVLRLAVAAVGAPAVHVVSRSADLLDRARAVGAQAIVETGHGLNAALEQASTVLAAAGDGPILSLSVDLPQLGADDLAALIIAPGDVVCATDSLVEGTNALLQRRPGLIPYRYGPGSLAAHRAEAEARGLAFTVVERPGLARDLDTPADLALLAPEWRG
ncbi:2-phospho-L-lactate guanylyltransferase [Novosphingobium bradum]|uniref:2-phospho-L-lactate guanylyltransferase n=1 Tax=Novosphingobium bradum TaxID=1737444 RepID=A0ABV7IML3_9SPHN